MDWLLEKQHQGCGAYFLAETGTVAQLPASSVLKKEEYREMDSLNEHVGRAVAMAISPGHYSAVKKKKKAITKGARKIRGPSPTPVKTGIATIQPARSKEKIGKREKRGVRSAAREIEKGSSLSEHKKKGGEKIEPKSRNERTIKLAGPKGSGVQIEDNQGGSMKKKLGSYIIR